MAAARKSTCSPSECFILCVLYVTNISSSNVVVGVAGLTADANSLVNYARTAAQRHLFTFNEDIPVEQLAQRLCDLKQGYTQYGGTEGL